MLVSTNQDGADPCRIITVVTSRAASAAADLLSFGDYAIAYEEASVFYHGVRYAPGDPLTLERASEYAESLRWRNDLYAMALAKRSVKRFIFRYAMARSLFADYRRRSANESLSDLQCFVGVLGEKLSQSAMGVLGRARKRNERYENLVEQVMRRASKNKKFQNPKRTAEFEVVVLKAVVDAVAARNKDAGWSFRNAGLTQLSDDFLLLLEYASSYDSEDLKAVCNRWGNFFLTQDDQEQLKAIADDAQRETATLEKLKPLVRPVWLFFVALCHSLQEGEHDLTGRDACWLGLIDEVLGMSEPESLRSIIEFEPDEQTPV